MFSNIYVWIIGSLVLLAGVGVFVYFFFFKNRNQQQEKKVRFDYPGVRPPMMPASQPQVSQQQYQQQQTIYGHDAARMRQEAGAPPGSGGYSSEDEFGASFAPSDVPALKDYPKDPQ